LGKQAKEYMAKGQLVPDSLIVGLIEEKVKIPSLKPILLDGFPRSLTQAKFLEPTFPVDVVVHLDIPHQVIMDRMAQRWIHFPSGRTYSYDYNPPKIKGYDDITGEALSQREDDKPEVVKRRLQDFDNLVNPLLEFYRKKPNTYVRSFAGTESNVIYPQIEKFFTEELKLSKA
jgi:nucleoside-triphosphate--adenylate kinase